MSDDLVHDLQDLKDKFVTRAKSFNAIPDFFKKAKQKTMKLQRKKEYKQSEKDVISEQNEKGYKLSVSGNNDNDEWNMIDRVNNNYNDMNNNNNKNDIHQRRLHSPEYNNYHNHHYPNNQNIENNQNQKPNMSYSHHQKQENNKIKNDNKPNHLTLSVGDNIQFNSDPDDDDIESHNHSGQIMSKVWKQIRIKLDNGNINTYFIDEIKIQPNIEEKNEYKNEYKNDMRPQTLSLVETLRITGIEQPYWWSDQSNNNKNHTASIVITWDTTRPISDEIIAKFYAGLNVMIGDEINDIEIYSIQNLKLWKKYQRYRTRNNANELNNIKEHYLWYGTCATKEVNDICNLGFENINTIVFAKTSAYHYNICAKQKLKPKKKNYQYLFLCRIAYNYKSSRHVIAVQHNDQVYPQFLIRFKKVYKQNNERQYMQPLQIESEHKKEVLDERKVPEHGWIELYTDDGQKYYQNEITKETQWERPIIMDMNIQQLDIAPIKHESKSMSQLQLLQQEIPGVSLAKSNPLPLNNVHAVQPIYHSTWTCTICTFADNRKSDGICSVCDSPKPGKIKCNHCTALNDEQTKICIVCCKTIAINDFNIDVEPLNNIPEEKMQYNGNQNNYNEQNNEIMDPELVKHIEEEFEYHEQKNKQQNIIKAIENDINNMHQVIHDANVSEQSSDDMDLSVMSDSPNNNPQHINDMLIAYPNNNNNTDNVNMNLFDNPNNNSNSQHLNNMLNLMDKPNDNDNINMQWMDYPDNIINHPQNIANMFMDHPNNNNNNMDNMDLLEYPNGNQKQFLQDLELARKLQQQENHNLGSYFDNFIRQHSAEFDDEGKEEYNEHVKHELPPVRRKQPVHGNTSADQIMILYHVTSHAAGKKIKQSNKMIRGSSGMFGGGIYFAETVDDAHYKAEHKGMVVTCRVYVGKCWRVDDCNGGKFTFTSLYKKGYDSVWAPNGSGQGKCERVVYNWDQVVIVSVEDYDKAKRRKNGNSWGFLNGI